MQLRHSTCVIRMKLGTSYAVVLSTFLVVKFYILIGYVKCGLWIAIGLLSLGLYEYPSKRANSIHLLSLIFFNFEIVKFPLVFRYCCLELWVT